ncbi:MAG: helix-turn-helix domain-containing protein, partial [Acidimicrobiales bacterium]
MARPKGADSSGWTPSQVVAYNLTQARLLRGLTQVEIAERLSTFTGTPWSAVTVAQAEGSVSGKRVRQFTANELVALARTFDLPVLYFFLPPENGFGALRTPDVGDMPWEYLLLLVWGHRRNFPDVAERAAPWAH